MSGGDCITLSNSTVSYPFHHEQNLITEFNLTRLLRKNYRPQVSGKWRR